MMGPFGNWRMSVRPRFLRAPVSGRALALRRFIYRALISLGTGVPAILFASLVVPGFTVTQRGAALLGLIILSIVNALVRPLLVRLTLPINILTAAEAAATPDPDDQEGDIVITG